MHGLTAEFLADKPLFAGIADEFLSFVGLLPTTRGFAARGQADDCARALDTLALARRKHPGAHNTLDELCALYGVDRSRGTQHGAPLGTKLLAAVYVELTCARQAALQLEPITPAQSTIRAIVGVRPRPLPRG